MKLIIVANWHWVKYNRRRGKKCPVKAWTFAPYIPLFFNWPELSAPDVVADLKPKAAAAYELIESRWKSIRSIRGTITITADGTVIPDIPMSAMSKWEAAMQGTPWVARSPKPVSSEPFAPMTDSASRLLPD